jgi:hypothetical protein
MDLKSPLIFSFLILMPSVVYAIPMTDDQVMAKYSGVPALQDAINSCQVSYGDLPSDIQVAVHDNPNCQTQSSPSQVSNGQPSTSTGSGLWGLLPMLFGIFIIPFVFKFITRRKNKRWSTEGSTKHGKIKINGFHSILLMLGIVKLKTPKDNPKPKHHDLQGTLPKGFEVEDQ